MRKLKNNYTIKIIALAIISVAVSLFIEGVVCNFRALTAPYQSIYVVEEGEISEVDGQQHVVLTDIGGKYVNKIWIKAKVLENSTYQIHISYTNSFGVVDEETITDTLSVFRNEHYTIINKNVNMIEVIVPKAVCPQIESIGIKNNFYFNKYRWGIVLITCVCLIGVWLFKKEIVRRTGLSFAMIGILFSLCITICTGARVFGWDEQIHYNKVVDLGYLGDYEPNGAEEILIANVAPDYNTYEEKAASIAALNQIASYEGETIHKENWGITFGRIPFVLPSIGYKLVGSLNMGFNRTFMLGKMFFTMIYIALMGIAIWRTKRYKILITCIGLMPTSLFLASSYTYDCIIIACAMLGFVLWMNEILEPDKRIKTSNLLLIIGLFSFASLSKAIYAPLLLLIFLFNKNKLGNKKNMWLLRGIACGVILALLATMLLPTAANTIANNVDYGGDKRGGDTGSVRQILSILNYPFQYIKLLVKEIFSLDNFRNFGDAKLDDFIFLNLGFLSFGKYGTIPDKYVVILLPILFLAILGEKRRGIKLSKFQMIFYYIVLGLIVVLIWSALYVQFTVVGAEQIAGVQVRYYLPITVPLLAGLPLKKWRVGYKESTIYAIVLTGIIFFLVYGLWTFVLPNGCL